MSDISERIVALRMKKDISQADMAKSIKISPSVMNRIELGTRAIRDNELIAISKFLEVSSDYILGIDTKNYSTLTNILSKPTDILSPDEEQLILDYRKLSEKSKGKIEGIIHGLLMGEEQVNKDA